MEEPLSRETVRGEVHFIAECEVLGAKGCTPPRVRAWLAWLSSTNRSLSHFAGSCLSQTGTRDGRASGEGLESADRAGEDHNPQSRTRVQAMDPLSRDVPHDLWFAHLQGMPSYVSVNYRSEWLHIRARRASLGPIQTCRACGIWRKKAGVGTGADSVVAVAFCLLAPKVLSQNRKTSSQKMLL
jgi:hypothetical protein